MALAREVLEGLAECLRDHAGLDLPKWVVEERARARMKELELEPRDYLELLTSPRGASELGAFTEAVRVGETRFFRHKPQFDAVLSVVVPALRARGIKKPRAWSVGCASGEEAYTIALVLSRAMPGVAADILATDVSRDAIEFATRAIYPRNSLDHVPSEYRRFFEIDGDSARVTREVARLVRFEKHNLNAPDRPRGFHLVFCRNVLIYFEPEARKRALEKLVGALEPGGFLFAGYSESLRDVPGLRALEHGDQVLWVKDAHHETAPKSVRKPRVVVSHSASKPTVVAPPHKPRPRHRSLVRVHGGDVARLSTDLGAALASPGLATLTVDLDAAELLVDEMAPVLKRAQAAARAAGIELTLRATREAPKRWLRRNRIAGGEA